LPVEAGNISVAAIPAVGGSAFVTDAPFSETTALFCAAAGVGKGGALGVGVEAGGTVVPPPPPVQATRAKVASARKPPTRRRVRCM
jgi:hypothetical protein